MPTAEGPPASGSRGWLIHLDRKAVVVTHVGFVEATGEGRSWGLVLHLLETSGQSSRCRIRFFRNPTWARQIDFQGELIIDLSLDGDAVLDRPDAQRAGTGRGHAGVNPGRATLVSA